MKQIKETAIVKLTDNLHLFIEGIYTPEEPGVLYPVDSAHPGSPSEFEIENIEIYRGTVGELMNWNDEWFHNQIYEMKKRLENKKPLHVETLFEYLSELCIDQIENR